MSNAPEKKTDYPRWVKVGGRWAVRGPSAQIKPGELVQVWSHTAQAARPVRMGRVVPEGHLGDVIGYPDQRPLPPRLREPSEYDPATAHRGGRLLPRKGYHSGLTAPSE